MLEGENEMIKQKSKLQKYLASLKQNEIEGPMFILFQSNLELKRVVGIFPILFLSLYILTFTPIYQCIRQKTNFTIVINLQLYKVGFTIAILHIKKSRVTILVAQVHSANECWNKFQNSKMICVIFTIQQYILGRVRK